MSAHVDLFQWLLGPTGGLVGIVFGMGAVAGWGFASKTVLKVAAREREECEKRCDEWQAQCAILQARVKEVEDAYTHGMERQLGQTRQSTVTLLTRGEGGE